MEIINIKNNLNFLREYIKLCSMEWGSYDSDEELNISIDKKNQELLSNNYGKLISVLGLIDNGALIGFISLFKYDGNKKKDLTPWYSTMYIKKEYRRNGYSKILNDAILLEAKYLGYSKIYLKSDLINYYEKFGAICIGKLNAGENLFYIELD